MKIAFITGSSRGIGRAIALRLAKDGFRIVLHGATESDKLLETKKAVERIGGKAEIAVGDLCDLNAAKPLSAKVAGADVLILNASSTFFYAFL